MSSLRSSPECPGPDAGRASPAVRDPFSTIPTQIAMPPARAAVTGPDGEDIAVVTSRIRPADSGEPGPEAVVSVRGDIDIDTAPLAQETLLRMLEASERVCLDLTDVRFFGAAGVRVVIVARQRAATLGRGFRLSGVHGITERVLTLSGLHPGD